MPIKPLICCDKCGDMIEDSTNFNTVRGLAVLGNIHVVDSKDSDGVGCELVGNNLVKVNSPSELIDPTDDYVIDNCIVNRISYYCKPCFLSVLFNDG